MIQLARVLWAYRNARRLRFTTREALERHQTQRISAHLAFLQKHSPFYSKLAGASLAELPLVDKATCLQYFDTMNTAGLTLDEVQRSAFSAEQSRDFAPTVRGYTVGLSSGTSGTRGVFVASRAEQATWAGLALARLLPQGLFSGERIAFFLRAGSNLYSSVQTPWITFKFFDLLQPFEPHLSALQQYQPTIVVAPAQVLRALALAKDAGRLAICPSRVVSVAEVLEPADKLLLANSFAQLAEVYQATEGFLAYTCPHGTLHLNEEYLHVEPEWLDTSCTRFVPIITDFTRTTQPVIRYRLNDILVAKSAPCPCGNPALALSHIEGRCDDQLVLPALAGGTRTLFADSLSRMLLQALPWQADYRLTQTSLTELTLVCSHSTNLREAKQALSGQLLEHGIAVERLCWTLAHEALVMEPGMKRRRIRKQWGVLN